LARRPWIELSRKQWYALFNRLLHLKIQREFSVVSKIQGALVTEQVAMETDQQQQQGLLQQQERMQELQQRLQDIQHKLQQKLLQDMQAAGYTGTTGTTGYAAINKGSARYAAETARYAAESAGSPAAAETERKSKTVYGNYRARPLLWASHNECGQGIRRYGSLPDVLFRRALQDKQASLFEMQDLQPQVSWRLLDRVVHSQRQEPVHFVPAAVARNTGLE
jgi:hypothetical protein